jgi:predicted DNA-binding WGR domain protein
MKDVYLEFHDASANSHKFYCVEFSANSHMATITWGRIGTEGQSQRKTAGEAQAKVQEKLAKGYRVKDIRTKPIDPFKVKEKSANPRANQEALEAAERVKQKRADRLAKEGIWEELAAQGERKAAR